MSLYDATVILDGYYEDLVERKNTKINELRHVMWSNLAPWSKNITPQKLIPLDIDRVNLNPITKEEFLKLAKKYKPSNA